MIDGPFTEKYFPLEIDVVQLVPVDEPAGGAVADHRVVLPAVPQPAGHLDGVGGLVEQIDACDVPTAEQRGLVLGTADPHLPAGPAVGDEVKRGNGFGDVEGLGVGDGRDRDEPDVTGDGCDPRCDEHRVRPARQPPRVDFGAASTLRGERIVERHEVQQPAFGGDREAGPVAAAGDGRRAGRLPPRLGMPAVAVECDRQMQMFAHGNVFRNASG